MVGKKGKERLKRVARDDRRYGGDGKGRRECWEQGCLAFARLLLQEKHRLRDCPPLYREERWKGKRERLE